jgi:hypothetical protein
VIAARIVEDIADADERFLDGRGLGAKSTMDFLEEDMDRLLSCGIPNVPDESYYYATVATLRSFYGKASDQLPHDVIRAAATYTVTREQTSELLDMLNAVLDTQFVLPPWSL